MWRKAGFSGGEGAKTSFARWLGIGALAVLVASCSESDSTAPTKRVLTPDSPSLTINGVLGPGVDFVVPDATSGTAVRWTAGYSDPDFSSVGTGVIRPFLDLQDSSCPNTASFPDAEQRGFNTDDDAFLFCQHRTSDTNKLPLNYVPTINVPGFGLAREFVLDAHESDSDFHIDDLEFWLCDDLAAPTFNEEDDFRDNENCTIVYKIDEDIAATDANSSGSGNTFDYRILVPEALFSTAATALGEGLCTYNPTPAGETACGLYLIVWSEMSDVGSTFEEFSTILRGFVTVAKTANTSLTREHNWDIEKSVDKSSLTLFDGQSGTVNYDVQVVYSGFTDSDWAVSGNITIANPSAQAVEVTSVTDVISGLGAVTVVCPGGLPQTLDPAESLVCTYSTSLPDGTSRTNTASVVLEDAGTTLSPAVPVNFATATITEIDENATITDNVQGALGNATAPNTPLFEYSREFTCGEDAGSHGNTATITETDTEEQNSDDANVTVNCAAISVTKDAATTFTRTWAWTIDKVIDPSCFLNGTFDVATQTATILENESLDVCYDITVNASSTDSDWRVTGSITIHNNHPTDVAVLTSVTDALTGGINATVVCPSLNVPAAGDLVCTYSANLPNATARTNTATATFLGQAYQGTANVTFGSSPTVETDECINVKDYFNGDAVGDELDAEYCAADGVPHTFQNFTKTITPDLVECGPNVIPNVAKFVTNNTGATGEDGATLNVNVECIQGCTLTLGYWKTHNESFNGGKHADPTWDLLDGGLAENTVFFLSGQTWYQVFWTNPQGNVYYNLAWQYMAAKLNVLAGATAPAEVTAAIAAAETLFGTYTPAQAGAWKGKQGAREQFITLAGTLGSYNEGAIGPGHCTENVSR